MTPSLMCFIQNLNSTNKHVFIEKLIQNIFYSLWFLAPLLHNINTPLHQNVKLVVHVKKFLVANQIHEAKYEFHNNLVHVLQSYFIIKSRVIVVLHFYTINIR